MEEKDINLEKKEEGKGEEEKKEEEAQYKPLPLSRIFKYTTPFEKMLLVIGSIAAICQGVAMPLMIIFLGEIMGAFTPTNTPEEAHKEVEKQALLLIIVGCVSFAVCVVMMSFWILIGERIGIKFRVLYLQAIFTKDITWFDLNKPQELPSKIINLCTQLQKGIGEKIANMIFTIVMAIAGIIIGMVYGWQLALASCGMLPLVIAATIFMMLALTSGYKIITKAYAVSGGYAEEALTSIRTVQAFSAEEPEANQYVQNLDIAKKAALKRSRFVGGSQFVMVMGFDLTYAVGFLIAAGMIYYGVYNDYRARDYLGLDALIVMFSMITGFFALGQVSPLLKAIRESQIAAAQMIPLIEEGVLLKEERKKQNLEKAQIDLSQFHGKIEFKNVEFKYPSRPTVKILEGFNMEFEEGKMTAICGETGCGKSTIIQLLERFYDPLQGDVLIDGRNLKDLDLEWYRKNVGYVAQEPVLFDLTIKENILYGKPEATDDQIISACKKANCYDFIMELPEKFEEKIGSEGSKLSGGQKQRIAIARALIKEPKILLLDEATSALDRNTEKAVQNALSEEMKGVTCIVIAHRLTTIENANKIVLLHDGKVAGVGTHSELLESCSLYKKLYESQLIKDAEEGDFEIEEIKKEEVQTYDAPTLERRQSSERRESKKEEEKLLKKRIEEEEEEKKATEEERKEIEKTYTKRVAEYNKEFTGTSILAMLTSFILGCHYPFLGVIFAFFTFDLLLPKDEMMDEVWLDFGLYAAASVFFGLVSLFLPVLLARISSNLTKTLRIQAYKQLLSMDMAFFDQDQNHPSKLNMLLGVEGELVNGAMENNIGGAIQGAVALLAGIIVAFVYNWRVSLVVLATVPFVALAGYYQIKIFTGFSMQSDKNYAKSVSILGESVKNFRTVTSFCNEAKVAEWYRDSLADPLSKVKKHSFVSGITYGFSQFLQFGQYAACFYFGSLFQKEYGADGRNMFVAIFCLAFAAMAMVK